MKIRAFVRNKSIYPLRGTNKPVSEKNTLFRFHLSPTGDEQTNLSAFEGLRGVFIPYGGRTNVLLRTLQTPLSIYPLRGTNKQTGNQMIGCAHNLSPTGDEQTDGRFYAYTGRRFIPYGGRTNVRRGASISRKRIYPLRGTEQTTAIINVSPSSPFIPYGGRTNISSVYCLDTKKIYPLRGTNKLA